MAEAHPYVLKSRFRWRGQSEPLTDVILTEEYIGWENRSVKLEVPLSDVLAARFSDKSQASPKAASLTVHYIVHRHRKLQHSASLRSAIFYGPVDDCKNWEAKVTQLLRGKFPQRPKRLLVFINPVSGKRNGPKVYQSKVAPIFELCGIQTDVIETQRAHHTEEILSTYDLSKVDGVVTVGGDGTYAEAGSGLASRALADRHVGVNNPDIVLENLAVPIGLIPTGTGDGIVGVANTTKDVATAAVVIVLGDRIPKHLATVHHQSQFIAFSVLLTGAGFFADIIRKAESNRSMGRARYAYGMLYGIAKHRTIQAEVEYLPCSGNSKPDEENTGAAESAGWVQKRGEFVRVDDFLYKMPTTLTSNRHTMGNGEIPLNFIQRCGRIAHARYVYKWLSGDPEANNFSYAEEVLVSAYRFHAAGEWRENPLSHYINVDGEIVHLPEPDFSLKIHKGVSSLFSWPLEEESGSASSAGPANQVTGSAVDAVGSAVSSTERAESSVEAVGSTEKAVSSTEVVGSTEKTVCSTEVVGSTEKAVSSTEAEDSTEKAVGSAEKAVSSTEAEDSTEKAVGSTEKAVSSTEAEDSTEKAVGSAEKAVSSAEKAVISTEAEDSTEKAVGSSEKAVSSTEAEESTEKAVGSAEKAVSSTEAKDSTENSDGSAEKTLPSAEMQVRSTEKPEKSTESSPIPSNQA